MQMLHALPAFLARIGDDAESLLSHAELARELRHDIREDMTDERLVLVREREEALDVLLRNHEDMNRSLRLNILIDADLIVFIDDF